MMDNHVQAKKKVAVLPQYSPSFIAPLPPRKFVVWCIHSNHFKHLYNICLIAAALQSGTKSSQPKIEANVLLNQLLGVYPAMRQPFTSFEKRITSSSLSRSARNDLAKRLLRMIKEFLIARQGWDTYFHALNVIPFPIHSTSLTGSVSDFANISSNMRKALSGLDSNNRHGSGTFEKMRMSAAYISNLQSCISNMSGLLVSSMLPQQRAAVQRFLSDVRRKVARSSEAKKVIDENCC